VKDSNNRIILGYYSTILQPTKLLLKVFAINEVCLTEYTHRCTA
jgi:hypothetical protein